MEDKEKELKEKQLLGIAQTWNSVEELEKRETKPRSHINASDLGGSFLDRWYKMKGEQPTNPYDSRTLRIFAAGNTFEDLLIEVFAKAEILISTQGFTEVPATEKTLRVLGYYDAMIGNVTNWEKQKEIFQRRCKIEDSILEMVKGIYEKEGLNVPTHYYRFSHYIKWQGEKILNGLAEKYPAGLPYPVLVEIKSINSNAFWNKKGYIGVGYPHHILQAYTYQKGTGTKKGAIIYISKDDLSLEECQVIYPTERIEKEWMEDVETMSGFILRDEMPLKEPDMIFEEDQGKHGLWKVNWKMGRSPYLTKITGYPDQVSFERAVRAEATPLNRKLGKSGTKKNETT